MILETSRSCREASIDGAECLGCCCDQFKDFDIEIVMVLETSGSCYESTIDDLESFMEVVLLDCSI